MFKEGGENEDEKKSDLDDMIQIDEDGRDNGAALNSSRGRKDID